MDAIRRDRLTSIVHEASQMDLRDFDRPDLNTFYIPEGPSFFQSLTNITIDFLFGPLIHQYKGYCWSDFSLDFIAALTNVCTLIPASISYASTLAFASNRAGLTSCVIPPIIYSFFGTSRHLSIGPSVLTSVITGIVVQNAVRDVNMTALVVQRNISFYTGVFCILLSFVQAGFIDNIISGYFLSGFISCVAILLITAQIPILLGIPIQYQIDDPIYMKIYQIITNITTANIPSVVLGLASVGFLLLCNGITYIICRKGCEWIYRIPVTFILILMMSGISYALDFASYGIQHLSVVRDMGMNDPSLEFLNHGDHLYFIKSILILTMVGYVEMQSLSRKNALQTGYTVNGNREFFAIGMCNVINSFFGGYVTFAAATRSNILLQNGSKTSLVNFISGVLSLIVVYALQKGINYVPRPVLAAIVIQSAFKLFSIQDISFIIKVHAWQDLLLFLTSFSITFCTSIFEGIIFSLSIAVLVIIKKVSFVNLSILGRFKERTPSETLIVSYVDIKDNPHCETIPGVMIVAVKGPFLFYNCSSFPYVLRQVMKEDIQLGYDLSKDLDIAGSSQTMNNTDTEEFHDSSENLTTRSQRLIERVFQEVRRLEVIAAADKMTHPYILIIDFCKCIDIDAAAIQVLIQFISTEKSFETRVILTGINDNYKYKFQKAGIFNLGRIGENMYASVEEAMEHIHQTRSIKSYISEH